MSDSDILGALPSSKTPEQLAAERQAADTAADAAAQAVAKTELDRIKAEADRLAPLRGIADALDADPSKIMDIRAVLEGRTPSSHATPPTPQAQASLTPDQLAALDAQITDKPFESVAALANLVVQQQLAEARKSLAPYFEASASSLVESFKSKKSGADPLFSKVEKTFESEMEDLPGTKLLDMNPADRKRELDRRYDAAYGRVMRGAVEKEASSPPSYGRSGGGGGGTQPTPAATYWEKHPELVALARATKNLSREDLESLAADLEEMDR